LDFQIFAYYFVLVKYKNMTQLKNFQKLRYAMSQKSNVFLFFCTCLISISFFTGCDEDEQDPNFYQLHDGTTVVEGYVLEFGSNKPVADALVILKEGQSKGLTGVVRMFPIDSTYTDETGYYKYIFKHQLPQGSGEGYTDFYYELEAHKNAYFHNFRGVQNGFYAKNKNIIIDPFAWINYRVKNVNPYDNRDLCLIGSAPPGEELIGSNIDTNQIYITRGNRIKEYIIHIRKNNILSYIKDSVYVAAFDTVDVEINY
jgi:hypothetical protein